MERSALGFTPVGIAEIAAIFDVVRGTVDQWRDRNIGFPDPVFGIGTRPAWSLEDIIDWAANTRRYDKINWEMIDAMRVPMVAAAERAAGYGDQSPDARAAAAEPAPATPAPTTEPEPQPEPVAEVSYTDAVAAAEAPVVGVPDDTAAAVEQVNDAYDGAVHQSGESVFTPRHHTQAEPDPF